MKLFITIMLLVLSIFSSAGCGINAKIEEGKESTKPYTYTDISPEEAKKRLDSEKNIVLLDVREPSEYTEKHIPGSVLIPVGTIEKEAPSKLTDKDAPIFVYCRSGRRSVTASEALVGLGYTEVYNLGGIIDWPYETESGEG
mgnify:CR=1 FL=1